VKVSLSWLKEYVDLPDLDAGRLENAFARVGLQVASITSPGADVRGPLVVGEILDVQQVPGLKKLINFCRVDVGEGEPRGIICGAPNVRAGLLVVVALPGAVLPGDFAISARKTYGHLSDGMICSGRELGISDEHDGIIELAPASDAESGIESGMVPGADARPFVGLDDTVVDLVVTPDRGYCLSVRGLARELSHSLGLAFRDPAAVEVPPATAEPAYPVTVEDPAGCDRFAARAVRGVDPAAASPAWMKRRLIAAGVRSINLPVDITNYLMLELGQPMHAFDLSLLRGPLVVRRARTGETLTTLDGVKRALDPEDMIICDDSGPVSLAAVMGGETSEVQPNTVDVLFEAAHWDPAMVARTCRRHSLHSEASKRWERGVDRELVLPAIEKAVRLLVEHGGGTPGAEVLDLDTHPLVASLGDKSTVSVEPVTIDSGLPARVAGVPYAEGRAADILREIGCAVRVDDSTVAGKTLLVVTPPTWRPDLTDAADLVEEVVRIDGYDRIGSLLPVAAPGNGVPAAQRRRRAVGRALAGAGLVEVLNPPFVGGAALDALGIPDDDPRRAAVRVRNPVAAEEPMLRTTLLPPLLATLRRNISRGHRDVALFEIGRVFHPAVPDGGPVTQPWHVAAVFAGDIEPAGWWGAGRPASWADAIDAALLAVEAAASGPAAAEVRSGASAPWHPGRCADIVHRGTVVGHAGELHPAVCAALDLPARTCAMELTLDALALPGVVVAPVLSAHPPALIDVAVTVDAATPAAEVRRALVDGAGELLESVRLFDVYTGVQVGEGRKSLAYKLTFRAPDRTLTAEEAVAARDAAVAVAAGRLGAVLRGA
jgi:phenylalanyl-tRNA synthetase beta chain